jgi:hypothetical protein
MTTNTLTATAQPTPASRRFAVRRYVGDTLIDDVAIVWALGRWQAARKHVTVTSSCYMVMTDRRADDLTPGATRWTLTERGTGSPAGSVTVIEVEEPDAAPIESVTIDPTSPNWAPAFALSAALDAAEPASSATGTASQWASALANLRDHLQDAGVPPETTDSLAIRHEGKDTWLTDVTTWDRVMLVASPSALEDAQYGLAWIYRLGRPQIIRTEPIPYSERASQRVTAAV